MKMSFGIFKSASAAAALSLALVACGGGEPAAKTPSKTPVAETEPATPEVVEESVVEAAATEVEEAAEAVEEVVEEAVAEVTETAEEVVDAATPAAADDRVTPAIVASYEALTGDAKNGKRVFTKCMTCHAVTEGRNMVGPSLYGIVGRPAGSIDGFKYSPANADSGIVWSEPTMFAYLENPAAFVPGTIMAFPGLPKEQDRADVIAYLKSEVK